MNEYIKTYNRVLSLLLRLTYKPGWRLVLSGPDPYEQSITITTMARMQNMFEPGDWTTISMDTAYMVESIAKFDEQTLLIYLVMEPIRRMELHEMDEWLRLDGECVHEPHPEARTT